MHPALMLAHWALRGQRRMRGLKRRPSCERRLNSMHPRSREQPTMGFRAAKELRKVSAKGQRRSSRRGAARDQPLGTAGKLCKRSDSECSRWLRGEQGVTIKATLKRMKSVSFQGFSWQISWQRAQT